MTTVAEAQTAIRSRAEANFTAYPWRWKNETAPLPDAPAAFVYGELIVEDSAFAGFGGGRGANLQRTTGRFEAHVMVPVGIPDSGAALDAALDNAEAIAAVFRSYRDSAISCFAAEVFPVSGTDESGNYNYVATVIVDLQFDKIG